MKVLEILLKFIWKLFLICVYGISKGTELLLQTINNAFKQLLDK